MGIVPDTSPGAPVKSQNIFEYGLVPTVSIVFPGNICKKPIRAFFRICHDTETDIPP